MVSAARSVDVVLLMQLGLTAGFTVAPSMASFEGGMALARHISQYYELRVCGSPEPNVCDVYMYVHAVGSDTFWWVGKSCAREGAGWALMELHWQWFCKCSRYWSTQRSCSRSSWGRRKSWRCGAWCAPLHGEFTSAQRTEDGMHSLATLRPTALDGISAEEGSGDAAAVAVLAMSDVGVCHTQRTRTDEQETICFACV